MSRDSKKTNQIGVRFDKDLLEGVVLAGLVKSPQTALNLYEKSYLELIELKVKINNEPQKKERIEKERSGESESTSERKITMKERIALEEANYYKSKKQ